MPNRHRVVIFLLVCLAPLSHCAAQEDMQDQIKSFEESIGENRMSERCPRLGALSQRAI